MLSTRVVVGAQTSLAFTSCLASSTVLIRSTRVNFRRHRPQNQARAFRIGSWSAYLDPNNQREAQYRHRILKHKYIEALNRKLRGQQLLAGRRHVDSKGFACGPWHGKQQVASGRWMSVDGLAALKNSQGNDDGGIEEVEQNPVDRLLRDHKERMDDLMRTRSRLFGFNWSTPEGAKDKHSTQAEAIETATSHSSLYGQDGFTRRFHKSASAAEEEYEIDPITNRKVFRNYSKDLKPGAADIKKISGYRAQFQTFSPPTPVDQVRESLKEFEKEEYKPVYYHEPDGRPPAQPDTVQEGLQDYDKRAKYEVVRGDIAEGEAPQKQCSVQRGLEDYDAKVTYGPVWAYEPDGKLPEKPCSVQHGLKDYDSKNSYGPVYYREPHGKEPEKRCSVQEGLSDYDSRVQYGPVMYKEPDGKDPEKPCSVQEGLKPYDESITYQPVYYNEVDEKAPEKPCSVQEGLLEYDSKANYGETSSSIEQIHQRAPPRTGMERIARYLGDDKSNDLGLLRANDVRAAAGIIKGIKKESVAEKDFKRTQLEEDFYRSQAMDKSFPQVDATPGAAQNRKLVEELRIEHSELFNHASHARGKIDAKIAEVEAGWQRPSKPSRLTGNFVRDFPEEFDAKWTSEEGILTPSITKATSGEQAHDNQSQVSSVDSFKPTVGSRKLETSLDRNVQDQESIGGTPSSQYAKNIERRNRKDLTREIRAIYEDAYGKIDLKHRQISAEGSGKDTTIHTESETPTLYKILAYDFTTNTVSEAETTSVVSDASSALTPAEALLRLENPAIFFPHFGRLQSQGFEILSGNSHALIFRKVRNDSPTKPAKEASFASRDYRRRAINPIDGMQPVVATGNFASPTGFVNHDLPEDAEPRFKSNIDVRREEPVFSGQSSWGEHEQSKRKTGGRGKRILLGAVWVGSCAYAVGVVAEFFKTGGIDGLGPKGL